MAIELTWKFADGIHTLHRGGSKTPVIAVVPDKIYPTMWRIKHRDGKLSDMVNLTRARDAAITFAMNDYRQKTKGVRAVEAPRTRSPVMPASACTREPNSGVTASSSL
jgi:hypothetical protein